MSEDENESHNRLCLPNGFHLVQDTGNKTALQGSRFTIYGEAGVNVLLRDTTHGEKGEKGTLVVDRGVILLQCSRYGNNSGMLSICAFSHDKMDWIDPQENTFQEVPLHEWFPCQRRTHP